MTGRVVWTGSVPRLPPVTALRPDPNGGNVVFARPAPNLPAVSPDGGVANAVVFLRGVDPARSRPWDRPPVTVEMNDDRPMVREGDGPPTNIGFVHAGDEVTIVSRQPRFHSLRARGAAFWTVTLPQPDRPRSRRLDQPGVVELSSGANDFWMRGYLWVCDHPYYVTTDAAGRWAMSGVPAGEYELVAWRPDWRTVRQERDPETGLVCRYVFRPPLETSRTVILRDGETTPVGDIPIKP
ncbi:MAG TPA: carboxypeptidase-like regulatory domain-containing protein [Gemmataceae bacterium]|nr:carboxypeptidase-like regulatory domain-containing protein [Gemmataceae bacterium]